MKLQIGVKVLIQNSRDEFLLIKRSKMLNSDVAPSWDIPGGRIEPDEALLKALAREVKEEIGHSIEDEPELLTVQDIFIENKDLHVVRLTYLLKEDVPEIVLSYEHTDYAWLTTEQIRTMTFEPYLEETLKNHINTQ